MADRLTKSASELFNEQERWNSFLELWQRKDAIKNLWLTALNHQLAVWFSKNPVDKWGFHNWGTLDAFWYLTEFGMETIRLWLGPDGRLRLWAHSQNIEYHSARQLLQTDKFKPLISCFTSLTEIGDGTWMMWEPSYTGFASITSEISQDELAWYAGHQAEALVEHIAARVNRFRTPIATQLLAELIKVTAVNK